MGKENIVWAGNTQWLWLRAAFYHRGCERVSWKQEMLDLFLGEGTPVEGWLGRGEEVGKGF